MTQNRSASLAPVGGKDRVLLTAYMSDALSGRNLGSAGYSYDFVADLFQPLLRRWGDVLPIARPETELDREAARASREGARPIHVSFRPFHHAVLSRQAVNVLVPAWEFPDIPDHEFDDDPRNNWVWMANLCDLVIVGGPFTKDAFQRGGVTTPIHVVPVPIPQRYFEVEPWQAGQKSRLDVSAYIFHGASVNSLTVKAAAGGQNSLPMPSVDWPASERPRGGKFKRWGKAFYQRQLRPRIPVALDILLAASYHSASHVWRQQRPAYRPVAGVDLSGVVYTSIFNPGDGRKNWEDTLTAFLLGLRDQEDATLVLKLISSNGHSIDQVFQHYRNLDIAHRCRLVIITEFLSDAQMMELVRSSTYYVNTARAEGNCLPLMNYLAAARPGLAPVHTAMGDYFSADIGFPIESHAEPAAWPQDLSLRCRTTWQRLVWPSLVEQFRSSYAVATSDQSRYRVLGEQAQDKMRQWASYDAVWPRLERALAQLSPASQTPLCAEAAA